MDKNKEIYNIGLKVDELQKINNSNADDKKIIYLANFIGDYFDIDIQLEQNSDYQIVYYYTKANFLTVLLEIAENNYNIFHDKISLYYKLYPVSRTFLKIETPFGRHCIFE